MRVPLKRRVARQASPRLRRDVRCGVCSPVSGRGGRIGALSFALSVLMRHFIRPRTRVPTRCDRAQQNETDLHTERLGGAHTDCAVKYSQKVG